MWIKCHSLSPTRTLNTAGSFVWSLQRMYVTGEVRKTGLGLGALWSALPMRVT